ncbi:acetamidase [Hypericibacter adhaerens]|uniref:Acetamidase n=1 Tax=Hypericibacter adhaerens TaxID=2602016 RepID=A0A5J6MWH0_9PROT|nr:acetamidase/formamidase family protein [Hypericibacter adhaerens]QEX21045.1 acetamidase [Hypericibacter adhaerens]
MKLHHHTLHSNHRHFGWTRDLAPALTLAPGDTVEIDIVDGGGGQITPRSTRDDIARLDYSKLLPLFGPIAVDGAKPGDALKITILGFTPSGWGWSGVIPGFGILEEEFKDPELAIWRYDPSGKVPALFGSHARVPLKPFPGTIGLAPDEPGTVTALPPRRVGGNLDTRDIAEGTVLHLPVEVAGGLLSVGDTHAAQGDGELAGSAIESPMKIALKVELEREARIPGPWFDTAGPATRHLDAAGYHVAIGLGQELMEAARNAVRNMIDLLCRLHKLAPVEAYMLCSVCGDLRISQLVNKPTWSVSLYFPRVVFE